MDNKKKIQDQELEQVYGGAQMGNDALMNGILSVDQLTVFFLTHWEGYSDALERFIEQNRGSREAIKLIYDTIGSYPDADESVKKKFREALQQAGLFMPQ